MSIPSNKYDIKMECGADYNLNFVLRDNDGTLIDLTGASVSAQLREYPEAPDYHLFTATHNSSGGTIKISMPHEDTASISYSRGVYDVYLTLDGNTYKVVYGDVTVYPNVTKPVDGEIMYVLSFYTEENFPTVGNMKRIYLSHASNKLYKWNGNAYISLNDVIIL